MRLLILITLLGIIPSFGQAQFVSDAVRWNFLEYGGTARSVAVGSSMGALGGDFSVASTNPAGMASYRMSEVMLSTAFLSSTSEAELQGIGNNVISEKDNNFNLNNVGAVLVLPTRKAKWRTSNVIIGLNRIANFNRSIKINGSSMGSITDRFLELTRGETLNTIDNFEAGPAYDVFAIDFDQNANEFYADLENDPTALLAKEQSIEESGRMNELLFGWAGNYKDKLYFGFNLGVPIVEFEQSKSYEERDDNNALPFHNRLSFNQRLSTSGGGVNIKFGMIYRLSQMIRIGGAIHTPTWINLTDEYDTDIAFDFTLNDGSRMLRDTVSPLGQFDYNYRSPWRYMLNAGLIIGKSGFISAEVDWVDYTYSEFSFAEGAELVDGTSFNSLNASIDNELSMVMNIRIGAEYVFDKFRIRAGYGNSSSPYENVDLNSSYYSFGCGLRFERLFIDAAFRRSSLSENVFPYEVDNAFQPTADHDFNRDRILLTVGYKFF